MDLKRISAIILAAGQSDRMGQNKLLMPFQGKPMLIHALDLVEGIGFGEKILVTSGETRGKIRIPECFTTVINENPGSGQASSLKLGVTAASLGFFMFFLADMPFLGKDAVLKLVSAIGDGKIIVPVAGNKPANPVIFPEKFRRELLQTGGDAGGRAVIRTHQADVKHVSFQDAKPFRDVDTPEDYKKYLFF